MLRRRVLLVAVLAAAAVGYLVLSGSDDDGSDGTARPQRDADVVEATCSGAAGGSPRINGKSDVVFDLFALMGARHTAGRRPDAFSGHGYKVPATLPHGVTATLSVPRASRSHVGLVYSLPTQERVVTRGVKGADTVVRFTACPTGGDQVRTGWPGGLVVDRPRCATLAVTVAGRGTTRQRVPLGRRC